jgi:hypothetical protein
MSAMKKGVVQIWEHDDLISLKDSGGYIYRWTDRRIETHREQGDLIINLTKIKGVHRH